MTSSRRCLSQYFTTNLRAASRRGGWPGLLFVIPLFSCRWWHRHSCLCSWVSPAFACHRHPERSGPIFSSAPLCGASGRGVEGSLRPRMFNWRCNLCVACKSGNVGVPTIVLNLVVNAAHENKRVTQEQVLQETPPPPMFCVSAGIIGHSGEWPVASGGQEIREESGFTIPSGSG